MEYAIIHHSIQLHSEIGPTPDVIVKFMTFGFTDTAIHGQLDVERKDSMKFPVNCHDFFHLFSNVES